MIAICLTFFVFVSFFRLHMTSLQVFNPYVNMRPTAVLRGHHGTLHACMHPPPALTGACSARDPHCSAGKGRPHLLALLRPRDPRMQCMHAAKRARAIEKDRDEMRAIVFCIMSRVAGLGPCGHDAADVSLTPQKRPAAGANRCSEHTSLSFVLSLSISLSSPVLSFTSCIYIVIHVLSSDDV